MKNLRFIIGTTLLWLIPVACLSAAAETVSFERVPEGGLQPQVAVDDRGVVHLVYLKGDEARSCDVRYARRNPGEKSFSKPIRVNSQPGSAVAGGNIRGAQIAIGRNNRPHIVWNGPHVHGQENAPPAPMFYARLDDSGTAFEPQRNLMTWTDGLDGGGSVAADKSGNVYVTWHGRDAKVEGGKGGEARRSVFVSRSKDDGKTFEREIQMVKEQTGACGCCGMRAWAGPDGSLYALYRSASTSVNRDMMLVTSKNGGKTSTVSTVQKWNIGACPMSSAYFATTGNDVLAAWETNGEVAFGRIPQGKSQISEPVTPERGTEKRKYPFLATRPNGDTLLVWSEGVTYKTGGKLAWQVFSRDGKPTAEKGRTDGLPAYSLPAAWSEGDRFVIIY